MPKYVYLLIPLTVIGIYAMYKKSLTDLVKSFEGFSAKVYRDSAGLLTIGYGHLIKAGENFSVISEAQATEILYRDLTTAKMLLSDLSKFRLRLINLMRWFPLCSISARVLLKVLRYCGN